MVTTLCQFLFDEYGVTDWIVNENSQIWNVDQNLQFNEHVTCTRNDMERSQRTVKVLDVDIDNSFPNGVIESMSSLRETVQSNLVKMKIPVELLVGCVISIMSKVITNSTVPVAIIAATKDKKLRLRNYCAHPQKKLFSNGQAHFTCTLNLSAHVTKRRLLLQTNKFLSVLQPTTDH